MSNHSKKKSWRKKRTIATTKATAKGTKKTTSSSSSTTTKNLTGTDKNVAARVCERIWNGKSIHGAVDFSGGLIDGTETANVARALSCETASTKITSLSFEGATFDNLSSLSQVLQAVSWGCPRLTTLNLASLSIQDGSSPQRAFADLIRSSNLASLNLSGNHLGVAGVRVIATALTASSQRTLLQLNLKDNDLGAEDCSVLHVVESLLYENRTGIRKSLSLMQWEEEANAEAAQCGTYMCESSSSQPLSPPCPNFELFESPPPFERHGSDPTSTRGTANAWSKRTPKKSHRRHNTVSSTYVAFDERLSSVRNLGTRTQTGPLPTRLPSFC